MSEVLSDGENALIYPSGDVAQLAICIQRPLTDVQLRSKLGSNARDFVQERFTWERYADNMLCLFKQVLKQPVDRE